ncbi:hypothetical protein FSOLCH5_003783 [Fusarium solani]
MASSRDRDAADSLQATYNILKQISRTLWRGEHDPQLRGFYAELHAYFTIICYHLKRISSSHVTIDKGVHNRLLDCIKSIFTRNLLRLSSDARLRRLDEVRDDLADNGAKVEALQLYLDFGATQIERDDFLESLSALEKELETRYPEDMSQWAPEDFGPLIKINEPSYAVWNAAQSIFKALVACKDCVCTPTHDFGARLCLGTHRKLDYLDPDDLDPDDFDPDDMDPDDWLMHRCPILVTLAMMLLEIYFATPFDVLARRYKVEIGDSQSSTKHLDFYVAVGSCLDPQVWETEDGGSLSSDELRSRIYEKVVLPLETELSQAYSSISINDLDKFAETLDFASWDQTIQTLNQQNNVEASRQNAELALGLERSCSLSPSLAAPYHPPGSAQHPGLSNRRLSDLDPRATISASSTPNLVRFPSGSDAEGLCDSTASLSLESYPQRRYTVGILCALPKELLAVRTLFDTKHSKPKNLCGDVNNYALGTISGHMVVAACLPAGEYGTNAAADSASNMRRSFQSIAFCLLVGIGGGAPTPQNDIRLGDVVELFNRLRDS